jgi:hypothetical protein
MVPNPAHQLVPLQGANANANRSAARHEPSCVLSLELTWSSEHELPKRTDHDVD